MTDATKLTDSEKLDAIYKGVKRIERIETTQIILKVAIVVAVLFGIDAITKLKKKIA